MASRSRRPALVLLLVLGLVLMTSAATALRGSAPALGASTTLTILAGSVTVRDPDGASAPARDGSVVGEGWTIATGVDARAIVTYFEGSTVTIEPESELRIDAARNETTGTIIEMTQRLGQTWHVVSHLLTSSSRYELRTPAATASVRGTAFAVAVDPAGVTLVTTSEGAVATSSAAAPAEEVLVTPGTATTVTPGAPPAAPKPVPAPERTTTVTVGSATGVVLDPLGRANGIVHDRLVLQTPGATAEVVEGKLVVTLPDVPDGAVSAVAGSPAVPVEVVTSVRRGAEPPVVVKEVSKGERVATEIVSTPGGRPATRPLAPSEVASLPAPAAVAPTALRGPPAKDRVRGYVPELPMPAVASRPLAEPARIAEALEEIKVAVPAAVAEVLGAPADRSAQGKDHGKDRAADEAPPAEAPRPVTGFVPRFDLPVLPPRSAPAADKDAAPAERPAPPEERGPAAPAAPAAPAPADPPRGPADEKKPDNANKADEKKPDSPAVAPAPPRGRTR